MFQTGARRRSAGTVEPVTSTAGVDVLVVGAGPAGAAAAITARRLGLDVAGRRQGPLPAGQDLRRRPHHRRAPPARARSGSTCGRCRRTRRSPRPCSSRRAGRRDRRSRCPPTASTPASCPAPSSTPRSSTRARDDGVDVRDGVGVTDVVAVDDGGRRSTLDDGTTLARAVGRRRRRPLLPRAPHARCRRTATRRADLGTWHAFRQYFAGVDDAPPLGAVRRGPPARVRVGVPASAAAAPTSASACCATATRRARRASSSRRCGATSSNGPRVRGILGPNARARRHAPRLADPRVATTPRGSTHGRVLFVGDAANVVDPMTGEGIAQALETGVLAARAIAAARRPTPSPPRYRRDVEPRARRRPAVRRARCSTSCASRSAHAPRSRPPASRRGPAATSPAGCSRTTRAPLCSRPRRWHRGHVHRLWRLRRRL